MVQIRLLNLTKTYLSGQVVALDNVNLELPKGQFLAVLGPSGCGKSTLLRVVAGLERPDQGEIWIASRRVDPLPPARRNVAMVFQNYALYPHFTVYQNIAIGLKLRGYSRAEIQKRVLKVARMLGLEGLFDRYPRELSGGQQQRTALARALVRDPEVFLLDEPLSNLDAQIREETRSELKRLFQDLGATVIYVTHDQIEALTMADLVAVMFHGRIFQVGPPEEVYRYPTHRRVAEFVGVPRINILRGRIKDRTFFSEDQIVKIPVGFDYEGPVELGVRPESLRPGGEGFKLKTRVLWAESWGPQKILFLASGPYELRALVAADFPASPGEELEVALRLEEVHLFHPETGERLSF